MARGAEEKGGADHGGKGAYVVSKDPAEVECTEATTPLTMAVSASVST